jgi:hypothetical protein
MWARGGSGDEQELAAFPAICMSESFTAKCALRGAPPVRTCFDVPAEAAPIRCFCREGEGDDAHRDGSDVPTAL